ncbi:unnamed protein product, partial [Choristocarpus tenellus]
QVVGGKDILCKSKTGSGKTLAFAIPICEVLDRQVGISSRAKQRGGRWKEFTRCASGRRPRAIVVAPTRELAKQVEREFNRIAPDLSSLAVYGGTPIGPQIGQMRKGCDVIVGTPGRIIDHLEQGTLSLSEIQFCVLDEADLMLQMGFQESVERLFEQMPDDKQTTLWSATMPRHSQGAREATLSRFRSGRTKVLIATDVAARGLDIPGVDMVFHYRLPLDQESFVHRSGRTGRAGKSGINVVLAGLAEDEQMVVLEKEYSFKSVRKATPSGSSMMKEAVEELKSRILNVRKSSVEIYKRDAVDLLQRMGAQVALGEGNREELEEGGSGVPRVPAEGVKA